MTRARCPGIDCVRLILIVHVALLCFLLRFTMDILNKKEGPNIFWAICVACVVINLILFARSGMIDFDYFFRRELRSSPDEEAFENSVTKLKKNLEKRETFRNTLATQSEFCGDRKTFDIDS